jgi:hypothetical protein
MILIYHLILFLNYVIVRRKTRRRGRINDTEPLSYEEIQNMRFDPTIYGINK